jgi:hypothetical protein
MPLPEDIDCRIPIEFGDQTAAARPILVRLAQAHVPELDRVLRCVLYLAEGKVERLAQMADAARSDYRDVIWWAEYTGHASGRTRQVRDFTKPFHRQKPARQSPRLPADVAEYFDRKR